jgi:hypothetical protein
MEAPPQLPTKMKPVCVVDSPDDHATMGLRVELLPLSIVLSATFL